MYSWGKNYPTPVSAVGQGHNKAQKPHRPGDQLAKVRMPRLTLFQLVSENQGWCPGSSPHNKLLQTISQWYAQSNGWPCWSASGECWIGSSVGLRNVGLTEHPIPPKPPSKEFASRESFYQNAKQSIKDLDLFNVLEETPERIRNMLLRYESMWDGSLGWISMITMVLMYNKYCTGHTTSEWVMPSSKTIHLTGSRRHVDFRSYRALTDWKTLPSVMAPNPDGFFHLCVNSCKLNALTIQCTFLLVCKAYYIESKREADVVSTLNFN